MRILVLEDCPAQSEIDLGHLCVRGLALSAMSQVEQAQRLVELLRDEETDAILFAIHLPHCDGMEAFDRLKSVCSEVPIVIFSVHDNRELALEFVKRGAQDYLVQGVASSESLLRCLQFAIERNRVSLMYRKREQHIKEALENSHDAMISANSHWQITEWNILAERTFGWKREEVIGKSLSCIIPSHLQSQFLKNIKSYFAKREGRFLKTSAEIVAERRSGTTFPAEFGVIKIERDHLDCMFYIFVRDITKVKQSNEELEKRVDEQTEKLTQTNEELRQFAKIASHDLQEPLRAVQGFANLLSEATRGQLDKDCTDFIGFILDGTKRMKQLIQSILVHSQINNNLSIYQSTNCNSVLTEVQSDLRSLIEETGTNLDIRSLPDVAVERSQLVQLFQNLITNSIRYRGSEAPSIVIAAERSTHHWLFSVRDNGIGIEPQYTEKIFDMFSRLHARGQYPGTGIGLAICKRVVTLHGGHIWVDSKPGQGSVFMFTLPAVKKKRTSKMKARIEILLVEDSPSDIRLTHEALKRTALSFELTVVNDGVEAMEYLNNLKKSIDFELPHIILLDLNMPRKNGHEVLDEIKDDPTLSKIPVILLTVSERDEDVTQALDAKMNYYLPKPVTAEKLSSLIKSLHDLHSDNDDDITMAMEETHVRLVLAGNPHTSLTALSKLVEDPRERVRSRVAENSRIGEDLQLKLAKDSQPEVRASLCENINLAPSVLELLAKDESEDVRLAASKSPRATAHLLNELAGDANVFVAASAQESLSGKSNNGK